MNLVQDFYLLKEIISLKEGQIKHIIEFRITTFREFLLFIVKFITTLSLDNENSFCKNFVLQTEISNFLLIFNLQAFMLK